MNVNDILAMVRPWGTEFEQVRSVAERWRQQYEHKDWAVKKNYSGKTPAEIYEALLALPDTANATDVAAIIDNDSWIGNYCTFCGEKRILGFEIGQPRDYESATIDACEECARIIARQIMKEGALR